MADNSIRVNLWFHTENEKEASAYEYMSKAKNAGKSYTEYIADCILEHEEGEKITISAGSLDTIVEMISERVCERTGNKRMGI